MDKTSLSAHQCDLVADHFHLISDTLRRFVKRYNFTDEDELESAMNEALVDCAVSDKYDPSRGPFANFVSCHLWQTCMNVRRDAAVRKHRERDVAIREDASYEDISYEVSEALMTLNLDERAYVMNHYMEGETIRDMADFYDTYHQKIRSVLDSGISKLRLAFGAA